MLIPFLVPLLQALRFINESLAQPLLVVQVAITALVLNPVLPFLQAVLVGPVVFGPRWVPAFKVPEHLSAAHGRLQDIFNLLPPGKLVLFLKMRDADVPELRLDTLDFRRVVRSEKHDFLPRRLIDQREGRFFCFPQVFDAQLLDGPLILGIHRAPQRIGHLAQDQRVHIRIQHHQRHHRQRYPAGFCAASAAPHVIVSIDVVQGLGPERGEAAVDAVIIVAFHDGQDRVRVLCLTVIGRRCFLAAILKNLECADIPAQSLLVQGKGGGHTVQLVLFRDSVGGKLFFDVLVRDLALSNLQDHFVYDFVFPPRFRAFLMADLGGYPGCFRGERRSLFKVLLGDF